MLGFLFLGGALVLFFWMIALLASIFWIWMLISAVTNNGIGTGEKVAWVLVVLFLHFFGALIYFFIGHPKRT